MVIVVHALDDNCDVIQPMVCRYYRGVLISEDIYTFILQWDHKVSLFQSIHNSRFDCCTVCSSRYESHPKLGQR